MAKEKVVAGLDIGGHSIRVVVAVIDGDKKQPHIVGVGTSPSHGLRKGAVIDAEELTGNISNALEAAERMSGIPIHNVFVSIGGSHVESSSSNGVVAINSKQISENDVTRVLEAAEAVSLPPNRYRLRTVPKDYAVDSQSGVRHPGRHPGETGEGKKAGTS